MFKIGKIYTVLIAKLILLYDAKMQLCNRLQEFYLGALNYKLQNRCGFTFIN